MRRIRRRRWPAVTSSRSVLCEQSNKNKRPAPEVTRAKEVKAMTLYDRALKTLLGSRFEARADDLNRNIALYLR